MIDSKLKEVWLIDDDIIHDMALEILIKRTNQSYAINTFTNANEALEALKFRADSFENPPDFIFLDLNMNDMNGWEFLDEYSAFPTSYKNDTTLYMLSSSVSQGDRDRADSIPEVHDFLIKPLSFASLQTILE